MEEGGSSSSHSSSHSSGSSSHSSSESSSNLSSESSSESGSEFGSSSGQSGYSSRSRVSFFGGKYSFTHRKGSEFCARNCVPNRALQIKKCFQQGIKDCHSCKYNNRVRNEKTEDANQLCKIACNALVGEDRCDFYSYVNSAKKIVNKRLLTRFGLQNFKRLLLRK